ncbi:MAG TPA: xylose isomerase [Phycisphaerae bacterium]|nr:xylose isomerase [Phycisphaerae bacterium]
MAKSSAAMEKFTFGLWTVGNVGRDPFGGPVRPPLSPMKLCDLLGSVKTPNGGRVYGVNFHDNDLVPIDATEAQRARIIRDFHKALKDNGLQVPMATTNLFGDPIFKDGAFTSGDARVRAYAVQKTMAAMDLGAEFGAKTYVFWGGREGAETDAGKDPVEGLKHFRDALNFLCQYSMSQNYGYRFALEAKPNEPRGHIYLATTGNMLGFIETLDYPEMVGVNPEVAHEAIAGLNFAHHVAQALDAGKLFHIDLNDQVPGRYDQDFRFGAADIKGAFFLVKLLTDHAYAGSLHFDAHAYRTEDYDGVKDFAAGCIRTYLLLKEKAERFNADKEIQSLRAQINLADEKLDALVQNFSPASVAKLRGLNINRKTLGARGLPYERLDQLTIELLLGKR